MLNFKITKEERDLMVEVVQDKAALALLHGHSLRHTVWDTLRERGDPRRWPEALAAIHEPPADIE